MTVPIKIAGTIVEAVIDCGASGPVVGRTIACRMGIWKRVRKINIRQADGTKIKGGHYVVNTSFVFPGAIGGPISAENQDHNFNKFPLDAEVFDIGQKDVVLDLSWLKENNFSVDIPNSQIISATGVIIPCTVCKIPSIQLFSI